MLVRLTCTCSWPGLPRPAAPGQYWDLEAKEAFQLVEAGKAVLVTLREYERHMRETRCSA